MPFLLFIFALLFGSGASTLMGGFSGTPPPYNPVKTAVCYQLEEGVTVTVDPGSFAAGANDCSTIIDSKTYVRVRQKVKIIHGKVVDPGQPIPCGAGELLRVGLTTGGKEVFWLKNNHLGDDVSSFIFILLEKDRDYYHFDIYIDSAEKGKLASDPKYEFVRNCKETGGLVPVLEGPSTQTFPPQTFSLTDAQFNQDAQQSFDKTGFETNFDTYYPEFKDKYYMRIQENNKPAAALQVGILTKTVQGQAYRGDIFFHAGIVYLVIAQGQTDAGKSFMYNPTETKPPIGMGNRNPSLQLAALKFITVSEWTWGTPSCKPAIYLYPEKPVELTVKVKPQGKITVSDPDHGLTGWRVLASPDGTIVPLNTQYSILNTKYPYLYYEAELSKVKTPTEGWVVEKGNLENFFRSILPQLGLNEKESQDFLDYWLVKLSSGEKWFIGLIDRAELDRVEPIEFSVPPDNFIRVRFYFEEIGQSSPPPQAPQLPQLPHRSGFTAIDWGGILANGSCGLPQKSE